MTKADEVQAAQAAERQAFTDYKARVAAFVQTLKDAIAAAPNAGGLSVEQADAVITEANTLTADISGSTPE